MKCHISTSWPSQHSRVLHACHQCRLRGVHGQVKCTCNQEGRVKVAEEDICPASSASVLVRNIVSRDSYDT